MVDVAESLAEESVPLEALDVAQARALATKLLERTPNSLDDEASLDELLKSLYIFLWPSHKPWPF